MWLKRTFFFLLSIFLVWGCSENSSSGDQSIDGLKSLSQGIDHATALQSTTPLSYQLPEGWIEFAEGDVSDGYFEYVFEGSPLLIQVTWETDPLVKNLEEYLESAEFRWKSILKASAVNKKECFRNISGKVTSGVESRLSFSKSEGKADQIFQTFILNYPNSGVFIEIFGTEAEWEAENEKLQFFLNSIQNQNP